MNRGVRLFAAVLWAGALDVTIDELSELYESYMDPESHWFPVAFMEKLHDVCAAVYEVILADGGDALDLGAHRGFHTERMIKSLGTHSGQVIAVEGNPSLAQYISILVKSSKAIILNRAITPTRVESIDFTMSKKYVELSSIIPSYIEDNFPVLAADADLYKQNVKASTVDDIINEFSIQNLKFIKSDIEGIDFDVIASSVSVWKQRSAICIENDYKSKLRFELLQKIIAEKYLAFDCFMNELDSETWSYPERSPIDRFLLPAEWSDTKIDHIRMAVSRCWASYQI